jgi:hypothetical protein
MSAREDLEAATTILQMMLELRQADEPAVSACLRLVKRAASELDPAVDDTSSDDAPADEAITDQELRERYPSLEKEKRSAMDQQMGVTAAHTEGTSFDAAVQVHVLGVPHHE